MPQAANYIKLVIMLPAQQSAFLPLVQKPECTKIKARQVWQHTIFYLPEILH